MTTEAGSMSGPGRRRRQLSRGRPRAFPEWQALRRWGKLPVWEENVAGYLMRQAREDANLSQSELGRRLGTSQQAVAQVERWQSNPTVHLMRRWLGACGAVLRLEVEADPQLAPARPGTRRQPAS